MSALTLTSAIEALGEVTMRDEIEPGMTLESLEVDSLEITEWVYLLDERYELGLDIYEDGYLEDVGQLTVSQFYTRLCELRSATN